MLSTMLEVVEELSDEEKLNSDDELIVEGKVLEENANVDEKAGVDTVVALEVKLVEILGVENKEEEACDEAWDGAGVAEVVAVVVLESGGHA